MKSKEAWKPKPGDKVEIIQRGFEGEGIIVDKQPVSNYWNVKYTYVARQVRDREIGAIVQFRSEDQMRPIPELESTSQEESLYVISQSQIELIIKGLTSGLKTDAQRAMDILKMKIRL